MSFNIHFTLHVNGEALPDDVNDALTHFTPTPKGAASRLGNGPLSHSVELSYDLFDGPEQALSVYGWEHVAGTYWVSPDDLLFTVRFF